MADKNKIGPEVQNIKLLKPCRVREEGQKEAQLFPKGAVVQVGGSDKYVLLGSGKGAVTDEKKKAN